MKRSVDVNVTFVPVTRVTFTVATKSPCVVVVFPETRNLAHSPVLSPGTYGIRVTRIILVVELISPTVSFKVRVARYSPCCVYVCVTTVALALLPEPSPNCQDRKSTRLNSSH